VLLSTVFAPYGYYPNIKKFVITMRVHTKVLLTCLYLCAFYAIDLPAQSIKSCGHDHAQGGLFETPEAFEKAKSDVIKGAYTKYLKRSGQKNNSVITVPVVFHIIHAGEAEGVGSNLPAGRVQAQLDVLNADFSASNPNYSDTTRPEWDAVKDNPLITFCLATVDPNGAATTGIVRHDIEITGSDANSNNIESVKASIYWDSDKYMNVYVLSIPGTTSAGGVVGYAFLPYFGTVGSASDGIVVDYNWFGGDGYTQSGTKTLTHEVGHYLGLFHTFDGYACDEDDGLSDTPNIDDATATINPTLTCGNAMNPYPTGPSSCSNEHMYINYMDYVNDESCPTAFTQDQVAIMRGVLEGTAPVFTSRLPLVTNASTACNASPGCDLAASTSHTNTTCSDSEDGTATVVATDGTSPYSYEWSDNASQTTSTATGLAPGTYFVTTTDAGGCTVVQSAIIQAPSPIAANLSSIDESSSGLSDGNVSAAPAGGSPSYSYLWDNGLGSLSSYSDLAPGTYSVTITDSQGCIAVASTVVNPGPCSGLDVSVSTSNVTCFGGSDGAGEISISSGTGPYTYDWNGQTFSNQRFDLVVGSYTVIATDSTGCNGSVSFTITEPSQLTASLNATGVTGAGSNDGTITANVSGGTAPYQYTWSSGGGNIATQSNLAPGTYSVTITDANNCSIIESEVVADFNCSDFDIILSGGELLCAGDLSILAVENVASPGPYNYSWNTGETSDAISISAGGTYTVSVQDVNGCISSEHKVIADAPNGIGLAFASYAESTTDGNNGRIETQVTGGTPGYTYIWSNGGSSANLENLAPGSYTLTVSDANNCNETASVTVDEFTCTSYQVGLTTINVTCHNASDGAIDANPSGTGPFIYNWNTGATSKSIDLLDAGDYTVTVTDYNGCTSIASAVISQPSAIDIQINKTDESALQASDGTITTMISGGVAGYTFQWSDGSTNTNRTNLAPGTYSVTVNDNTLCAASTSVTIEEFNCSGIIIAPTITNPVCSGGASGAIALHIQEISAPYTVSWSTQSEDEQVSSLTSGDYSVTLTDAGGCALIRTFTLIEPSPLSGNVSATDETANDINNGTAIVTINGGTAPYNYEWSNGATTSSISNLPPADYHVTVSDSNGCLYVDTVSIGAYICPAFDIVDMYKADNLCSGDSHGVLGASISGGTAPFAFIWSNGSTSASIDGVVAGSYSVTVTDSYNCQVIGSESIEDPSALSVVSTISHVSAVGLSDGNVLLTIQGGVEPYTIMWSNGAASDGIDNLAEGTYGYTVTDNNGCTTSDEVDIDQYVCPNLSLSFETSNITCFGAADGVLRCIAESGTAPYTYIWSNGASGDSITELLEGSYSVTATDSRGCSIIATSDMEEPNPLMFTEAVTHESGGNANDGSIVLQIEGGTEPYEVTWTDGVADAARTQVSPGAYGFVIVDAHRCTISGEVTIAEFDCPDIELSITVFDNECEDGDVGGVDVIASNGTGTYTYIVNGVLYENASIRGLAAGSYELVVQDINGCSASVPFEVETPMSMMVSELSTDDTSGILPGAASVTVVGGVEPYSYLWSDGRTDAVNNALFPGIHHVTITDALGCTIIEEVVIHQLEEAGAIEDLQLFESHPNPASDIINIQVEFSEAKDMRVVITNLSGQPVYDEVLNTDVYDRTVDISGFPRGLYRINIYSAEEVITKPLAIF